MVLTKNLVYQNQGNSLVLQRITEFDKRILDIGCGAGDTGKLIHSVYPSSYIAGITSSLGEYEIAKKNLNFCTCMNIERDNLQILSNHQKFDTLLFLHVLEHLVDPISTIKNILPYLKIGGKVIIALPNIANWRERWKLAIGRFEYTDGGIMDKTHLHFYTFYTAAKYLIEPIPQLRIHEYTAEGSVPLGILRYHFLNWQIRQKIDNLGCQIMPNLFGGEIIIVASYTGES